ncbi:MAG: alpha/beta fold hydrolase [Alphaproteobacteria bacterium]|nr:alpha/beta fold hydrolase [Alphaproteobacteria bacterium]
MMAVAGWPIRAIAVGLGILLLVAVSSSEILAEDRIGVVLMHGKRGKVGAGTLIGPLEEALRDTGIAVVAPEMPWSRDRFLDKTFRGILAEIDAAVTFLKSDGVTRIVVGGHSLGGGAALAYGARRDGLAGVLVIAPGHFPESRGFRKRFGADVAEAKSMVAAGNGAETADFRDIDRGDSRPFVMRADAYVDFMDPEGPLAMPENAASLKPDTPLLLIIGKKDHTFRYGRGDRDYIFDKAPSHPKSRYTVVPGGHKATPRIGKDEIVAWLKSL